MSEAFSFFQTLGLGVFVYYLLRGLKDRVSSLESLINTQKQTLDVMERRVNETEKIGNIYRDLMASLPEDIDNFRTIISKTKDETIVELKNQNDNIKTKLKDAQHQIEHSGNPSNLIKSHLSVLKNLLDSGQKNNSHNKKSDLFAICEFNGRKIENCVPHIVSCHTFEKFISSIGLQLIIQENDDITKTAISDRHLPDGTPIEAFQAGWGVAAGWYCLVNSSLYLDNERLSYYKDEFSSVKTYV